MATIPSGQKFHTIASNVATKERGSALVNSQKEIFTMQDVANTVKPYKVYTALLTQSGGDDPYSIDTGLLTVGVTYYIYNESPGMDFTNVGAPNNNNGTSFVATGTTPVSWGINEGSGAILSYNTGAPVATVLENTIGGVWFNYDDIGSYLINSDGLFTENKTYLYIQAFLYGPDEDRRINISANDISNLQIITTNATTLSDDNLYNTPIEIRVYE
jgi:hypothetical protein